MHALRSFWLGEIDLAPIALFRILYGIQLLNWFWQLFPNLNAFFTDEGILPRHALLVTFPDRFSLLTLFGDWWQVALVWALSCGVAILLTVGWRTQLMSFLAFVLVSSFSWRNPLILDGSDFVFRMVPLWLAFTGAGDLYSLDNLARTRRGDAPSGRGPALPVRILELQVAWVYLATGVEKLAGRSWLDGTAIYYSLQLEHTFSRWWAVALASNLPLARAITWATLVAELAFLPLSMIPWRVSRLVAVVSAGALQIGIITMMNVGNFPVIMLSTLVLFLPPRSIRAFVDRVVGTVDRRLPDRLRRAALNAAQPAAVQLPSATPRRSDAALRRLGASALLAMATFAFATGVPSQLESVRPQGDLASLIRFLSADQRWDMFSPDPAYAEGWMLGPAHLADGTAFDLYTGEPPDDRSERYSDPLYTRWVKVHERIPTASYADYRLEYARYFCRSRNLHLRPGQAPLDTFDLTYVERTIRPPGEGPPLIRNVTIWSHKC
jgi:hypothetical protein